MDNEKISSIFMPHATAKSAPFKSGENRVVYYTSAEVAVSILKNREIWMRNALTMNDYLEIEYGLTCLEAAQESTYGIEFFAALNALFPNIDHEIKDRFKAWRPGFKLDTFITCFSEHLESENRNGRLSMWRAYGGKCGVALVFKSAPMFLKTRALAAYTSPVAYFTPDQVGLELKKITESIYEERSCLAGLGRDKLVDIVFNVFRFAALCNKHPGFSEEREWRVISSPVIQSSPLLPQEVEIVRGVPQMVLKLKLQNHPEHGVTGLELEEFLDSIIIGPCEFPHVVSRAFRILLEDLGVSDSMTKVITSEIPLRHF